MGKNSENDHTPGFPKSNQIIHFSSMHLFSIEMFASVYQLLFHPFDEVKMKNSRICFSNIYYYTKY